jgi:hemerythrin-like domain-containing protein
MKPTDELKAEHRAIERMLRILTAVSDRLESGEQINPRHLPQIVEFIQVFADRCHHGKEEDRLFPLMEQRGLPRHVGPIAVMLDDHKVGRSLIQRMGDALSDAREGSPEAARRYADAAASYVELLRDHIAKEDGVLFPLAESLLDEASRAGLQAEFERFEREDLEPGTVARMRALADGLARHFDVPLAAQRKRPDVQGHACFH